ncbi:MAG: transthyretin-like family protein [Nitrosopumilus sp.]|nr:transthyretin-like family protein [Nitrosopumilus sp.]
MADYHVSGLITNSFGKPVKDILVQVLERDQGVFEDRIDDLLGSAWTKKDGNFRISFNEKQFMERFKIFEKGPDIYLKLRNNRGEVIHTTKVRKDVKKTQKTRLAFKISLDPNSFENKVKPKEDPFSDATNRRMGSFSGFEQRADFTDNLQQVFTMFLSTLHAWANYNNEHSWRKIGYDGPLVPKFPWRTEHSPHKVKWKKS